MNAKLNFARILVLMGLFALVVGTACLGGGGGGGSQPTAQPEVACTAAKFVNANGQICCPTTSGIQCQAPEAAPEPTATPHQRTLGEALVEGAVKDTEAEKVVCGLAIGIPCK